MEITPTTLEPRLQKLVNLKIDGIDIMHGELKILMLEAEAELQMAQEVEEENERKYWEGYTDALAALYSLTYDLSFAVAAREAACKL